MSPAPITTSASRIAELLVELRQLAAARGTVETFYQGWLERLTAAVGAVGGRLRRPAGDGTLAPRFTAGAADAFGEEPSDGTSPSPYARLVLETYASGRVRVVPPHAAAGVEPELNPTVGFLLMAPLTTAGETTGVVELVLPIDATSERQKEAVQAALQAAAVVGEFEKQQREKKLAARQALVDEVERFTRAVHAGLSVNKTAFAIANDGRRLIGCDRVTVLVRRGSQYRVTAVSGLDAVETRSQAAKLLSRLASAVAAAGEPVWYAGPTDDLAPQLRETLAQYVDEAHVRCVAVLPLVPATDDAQPGRKPRPLGALVVEQFAPDGAAGRQERARLVAEHAAAALANALEHETIPLLPLWRAVGGVRAWFAPGTRAKTIAVVALLAAVAAALKFIPAELALTARAVLQPAARHHVFAPLDGTVKRVFVRHGQRVAAGAPLVELKNVDLDVALADAVGQRAAAHEQLLAVERALFEDATRLAAQERHRLAGQRSELKQRLASLDEQLRLLHHKREQLLVVSPIAGEVTTWNVEQLLRERPVRQGQTLVDVADTAGRWELELQVPEDGIGHLLRAQREAGDALTIGYRLAAEPEHDRFAKIDEVHWSAEVRGEQGNTVLARAALEPGDLPPLRPGAEATAKVYCGRRALGYVWLHDAVDFLRTKVLFRLY